MQNALKDNKIDSLRALLSQLSGQPLPLLARAAVDEAIHQLDTLADRLPTGQGETRLAALYQVLGVMGRSLDLDEVLTQVMDAVIGLTGAERGFLMLKDPDAQDWQLRAARNFSRESLDPKDLEVSQTVLNTLIDSRQGVVTTDAQTDPRFSGQDSVVFYSLRSIMCSPLLAQGKLIGAIYVDNRIKKGLFKQPDLDLLNAFAAQAAIAIENARLYRRTDQALARRVAELETLTQIDHELNAYLDLERVFEIIRKWAIKETGSKRAWLLLIRATVYQEQTSDGVPEVNLASPFVKQALQQRSPQTDSPEQGGNMRVAIPLLHAGHSIGVLVVEREQAYDEPSVQFLVRLAARASTAIVNNQLYLDVQKANLEKSKFVSVVSHELRVPMTSIRGYTDLLRNEMAGPINDQQANFLEVIQNNVERMTVLVSDLSDISRIETGQLKLERVPVSISTSIDDVVRSLQPKLEERKQTLTIDLAMNLPPIQTDLTRLNQVLTNLLSNAWKYTPESGSIRITVRKETGKVRIEVKDTGVGIDPTEYSLIFSQFFRSESETIREQPGWGLGLSVTKRLVELMGGTIGFESVLDRGSTFWFTLPSGDEDNSVG